MTRRAPVPPRPAAPPAAPLPPWLGPAEGGVRLRVHVVPRSSRTAVAGVHGDALKVALRAPPEGGRANEELCSFLAESLGLPRRAATLLSGASSRDKVLLLSGADPASAARLAP